MSESNEQSSSESALQPKVFVAMPAYMGIQPAALEIMLTFASRVPGRCCTPKILPLSHHCGSFNALLATAFNVREEMRLTHIVIQHQDVVPELYFVDKGLEIMERDGLDVLACLVPIKDEKRLTSVAVLDKEKLSTRRLSMEEVLQLPPTFRAKDLEQLGWKNHLSLPVAGLFFLKLDPDKLFDANGNSRVWFESPSRILRAQDGTYISAVWDEGWNISIQMLLAGMKIACTREIVLHHVGGGSWDNQTVTPREHWKTDAGWTDYSWILGKCPTNTNGEVEGQPQQNQQQKPQLITGRG